MQRPGGTDEDDGIILSTVINLLPDQPIFLVVLDAKTFTEIARAEVRISIAIYNLMQMCRVACFYASAFYTQGEYYFMVVECSKLA